MQILQVNQASVIHCQIPHILKEVAGFIRQLRINNIEMAKISPGGCSPCRSLSV